MDKKICNLKLNELETVVGGVAEVQVAAMATMYQSANMSTAATMFQPPEVSLRKR
jgi:hypothetical protein